jgi:dTDP-glucose 4,6-dehydratase
MSNLTHGTWLVTGGCGFIGAEFIRQALAQHPQLRIVNIDSLSYAASPERLATIADDPRYTFVHGDIAEPADVQKALAACAKPRSGPAGVCNAIVNFAAESHVDRSIFSGVPFVRANTMGVQVLLEAARALPLAKPGALDGFVRFLQVSTDEVYGDVEHPHRSVETDPIHTSSPYSASKAGGELLVQAFIRTFHFPAVITRCSNNYGPWHWPEKMIPLFITNLLNGKKVPVYGDGKQMREWIHVEDHASGIMAALLKGRDGEAYNFGGEIEVDNLTVTRQMIALAKRDDSAIQYVADRPGHDRRYALNSGKSKKELGWTAKWTFEKGLKQTFDWYVANKQWLKTVLDENYQQYYQKQYAQR